MLVIGLAALTVVPVAQFLSLGYLIEAAARVARSGRLRDGLIGVRHAARLGTIVVGCWLWLLPVRFVGSLVASANLIDPSGPVAQGWRGAWTALIGLVVVHLIASCARGGRVRDFAWPPGSFRWLTRRGWSYVRSRDATCDFVASLRLPYYLRLGALGFAGSMVWLVVPTTLLILGRRAPILGLVGGLMLVVVATMLPFLQIRFALAGRFAAFRDVRAVRERFRRAPWAFTVAFLITVLAAVPLYLLKIEIMPREIAGFSSILFVGFLFPARVACGWAYARGSFRMTPSHWSFRWSGRVGMLAVGVAYVGIVFLTQTTSWTGSWSLYEQHAFTIPVPFLGN